MKRVITAFLLLATTISASAQVSYQQMLRERNAQAPRYEHPQSITPVEGTNKYMRINFNRVLLYDYTSADNGVEVFAANNQLLSFVQSPPASRYTATRLPRTSSYGWAISATAPWRPLEMFAM